MHTTPAMSPLGLARPRHRLVAYSRSHPMLGSCAQVLVLNLILATASWVAIPMGPVPVTLQTLAVMVMAHMCGPKLTTAALAAYLTEGAWGMPVFALGQAGLHCLIGPTGGYLMGFVGGAWATAYAARGLGRGFGATVLSMLAGHAVVLAAGALWLSGFVGVAQAFAVGVTPFLGDAVIKLVVGALFVTGLTGMRTPRAL